MKLPKFNIGKQAGEAVKETIEGVAEGVDKFVHTKDEAEQARTDRQANDNKSESWLNKNIRPILTYTYNFLYIWVMIADGNFKSFQLKSIHADSLFYLSMTTISFYFVLAFNPKNLQHFKLNK